MNANEKKADEREEGTRSIGVLLGQIDDGCLHAELSEAVQDVAKELTRMVDALGRDQKGTVTLVLNMKATTAGNLVLDGDVKKKTPPVRRGASVFWVTPGGNLSVENPRQKKLPFRDVSKPAEPARDVSTEAPAARSV